MEHRNTIISLVKVQDLHRWEMSVAEAKTLQLSLASRVSRDDKTVSVRFVAGMDISVGRSGKLARAAVVVLSYPELEVVEVQVAEGKLGLPYIPGLLSFREAPLALTACERLDITPGLFLIDGQGLAHPRRFGLACHLGLFLDKPTIGCAKSLLCGHYEEARLIGSGSSAPLLDNGETIGAALRTRTGAKPVFVSIGHKISLPAAVSWVMQCCRGYRVPEPLRLAHRAASGVPVAKKDLVSGNIK